MLAAQARWSSGGGGRLAAAAALSLLLSCGAPTAASVGTASPATTVEAPGPAVTATTSGTATPAGRSTTTPTTTAGPTTTATTSTTRTVPASTLTTLRSGITGVDGVVVFSPVCPVERVPPDPRCEPRPGPARILLDRTGDGRRFTADAGADGRFSVPVPPGTYVVQVAAMTPGPGRGCQVDPGQVTVTGGLLTQVRVICDTGIR